MSVISAIAYGEIVKKVKVEKKDPKKQHSHFRVNGRNRKYGH